MSVELIDDGRIAGEKARDADVGASAAINPLKIERNPLYIGFNASEAIQGSASLVQTSVFAGFQFADTGTPDLTLMLRSPMEEISPGSRGSLRLWWTTSATSGNVRWVVDIKPIIGGFLSLASAFQRAVISPADSSTTNLTESVIELPPAIFSKGQLIGVKISRDGANTLDTIGAVAVIRGVFLKIDGRS